MAGIVIFLVHNRSTIGSDVPRRGGRAGIDAKSVEDPNPRTALPNKRLHPAPRLGAGVLTVVIHSVG